MNLEVPNKEYILQHTNRGWRCVSWHPHYIMTNWTKLKNDALLDGDASIKNFYDRMAKAGEALRIVYDRMIEERK